MQTLLILWALPNTLIGVGFGLLGLATGGAVRRHGHVLEFHGGVLRYLLERMPAMEHGASAITLGHTVLAVSENAQEVCRDHERVHVRQYERWGPFFLPAYLFCSLVLWIRGADYYRDNPFEREAYDQAG